MPGDGASNAHFTTTENHTDGNFFNPLLYTAKEKGRKKKKTLLLSILEALYGLLVLLNM